MTISELFQMFSLMKKGYISPSTIERTYIPSCNAFLKFVGDKEVSLYTSFDMMSFAQASFVEMIPARHLHESPGITCRGYRYLFITSPRNRVHYPGRGWRDLRMCTFCSSAPLPNYNNCQIFLHVVLDT